jgi:pimeloyl-ACP methyl ester carboxylesterase
LYVLVHGYNPDMAAWASMARMFQTYGTVLPVQYNAGYFSSAEPEKLAELMDVAIEKAVQTTGATHVVLVAHSMGALLARRALLLAAKNKHDWAPLAGRVVLLAGVSRGWDISGEPPTDASTLMRWVMRVGYWGANLLRTSQLIADFERGTRFVANLRLDWMTQMRNKDGVEVVQLLGDIDDIVRREDNEDLRVMSSKNFAFLRVRGTGHGDIVDFAEGAKLDGDEKRLGEYRRGKLLLAATKPFDEVMQQNEEPRVPAESTIDEIVFVLHGIRDLGRWSADFETLIRQDQARGGRIAVVSSRYGYFGMGPFLFKDVRDRYVRWFMDQYTETLARYPSVPPDKIRFFGHSNGTYILAEALQNYTSMRVDRIVFAGSVVPQDYPWEDLDGRVDRVRNYVGTEDWVVALFPRFFELPLVRWLGNDVGSAGFNGFTSPRASSPCQPDAPTLVRRKGEVAVENVCFIQGGHGAFDKRVGEIVAFLLDENDGTPEPAPRETRGWFGTVLSWSPVVVGVWALLAAILIYIGVRVVSAAPQPSWPVLLMFLLLLAAALRTA